MISYKGWSLGAAETRAEIDARLLDEHRRRRLGEKQELSTIRAQSDDIRVAVAIEVRRHERAGVRPGRRA